MVVAHQLSSLNARRIILASGSPRRAELLQTLGVRFEVCVSTFDELLDKRLFTSAADYARETALQKALEVARRPSDAPPGLVIGADTVVDVAEHAAQTLDVLEKPDGPAGARLMLGRLSGRRHRVHTGVALVLPRAQGEPLVRSFSESTEVDFAELCPELIEAYVASGEPFGKAGAYGIQGVGGSFVRGIRGCFYNVMGLPLHRVTTELARLLEDGEL